VFLGCDTETTGLKPREGLLLEVAIVVCDNNLQVQAQGSWLWPQSTQAAWDLSDDYVRGLHTKNGLWVELAALEQQVRAAGVSLEGARTRLEDHILQWLTGINVYGKGLEPMLCQGGSFDANWLEVHAPNLRKLWNHQVHDVSGIKRLGELWYGAKAPRFAPAEGTKHRALDDILHTVKTLQWAREVVFR